MTKLTLKSPATAFIAVVWAGFDVARFTRGRSAIATLKLNLAKFFPTFLVTSVNDAIVDVARFHAYSLLNAIRAFNRLLEMAINGQAGEIVSKKFAQRDVAYENDNNDEKRHFCGLTTRD